MGWLSWSRHSRQRHSRVIARPRPLQANAIQLLENRIVPAVQVSYFSNHWQLASDLGDDQANLGTLNQGDLVQAGDKLATYGLDAFGLVEGMGGLAAYDDLGDAFSSTIGGGTIHILPGVYEGVAIDQEVVLTIPQTRSAPAPLIASLKAETTTENQATTFRGLVLSIGPLDGIGATVDWGDGTSEILSGSGQFFIGFQQEHRYLDNRPDDAPYQVAFSVTDLAGDHVAGQTQIVVRNTAPEFLSLSASGTPENGLSTLSASFRDPGSLDGYNVVIQWGDGASQVLPLPAGSTGFELSHQYLDNRAGDAPYTIQVAITDKDGAQGLLETNVAVTNAPLEIAQLQALDSDEDGLTQLSGTITDPGTLDTHTVVVDWGDGTSEPVELVVGAPGAPSSFQAFHKYLNNRPNDAAYVVTVTAADKDSLEVVKTASALVKNVAPKIESLTATPIFENDSAALTVQFSDPGSLDRHIATINWGDGTTEEVTLEVGATSLQRSHQYLDNAAGNLPFSISVTLSDDDGGSDLDSADMMVRNANPVLTGLTTTPIGEGGQTTLSGLFSDVGSKDTHSLTIEWGDGTTQTLSAKTGSFTIQHVYANNLANNADFDVKVTVADKDSGTASVNIAQKVANLPPKLTSLTAPKFQNLFTQVGLAATASDPGKDPISYTWKIVGPGVNTKLTGATPTFLPITMGTYEVSVEVSDGSLTDAGTSSFEIGYDTDFGPATVTTTNLGTNFSEYLGDLSLAGGKVTTAVATSGAIFNGPKLVDASVSADISVLGVVNGQAGVLLRQSVGTGGTNTRLPGYGLGNYYFGGLARVNNVTYAVIYASNNNVFRTIASVSLPLATIANVRLEAVAGSLKLYVNDQLKAYGYDAAYTQSGPSGFLITKGATLDNFRVQALALKSHAGDESFDADLSGLAALEGLPRDWIDIAGGFSGGVAVADRSAALVAGFNQSQQATSATVVVPIALNSYAGVVSRTTGMALGNLYQAAVVVRSDVATRSNIFRTEISAFVNGSWQTIAYGPSLGKAAAPFTGEITLESVGSQLRVYVNGRYQTSVYDTRVTGGGAGVIASTGAKILDFHTEIVRLQTIASGNPTNFTSQLDGTQLSRNFTEFVGNFTVKNGLLTGSAADNLAFGNGLILNPSVEASINLAAVGQAGIVVRAGGASSSDYIWAGLVRRGNVYTLEIQRRSGASWVRLASFTVASGIGTVRLDLVGGQARVSLNGVQRLTANVGITTGAAVGLQSSAGAGFGAFSVV